MSKIFSKGPLSITAIFAVFFLISCANKNEIDAPLLPIGKNYYPLAIGNTALFDLDTVVFDPISSSVIKIDTYRWQAREILSDTFRSKLGDLTFVVDRSIKTKTSADWTARETFGASFTTNYALLSENNFIHSKIPNYFSVGTTWDGNLLNDIDATLEVAGELLKPFSKKWTFEVMSYGKAEKVGTKDYADVLTIRAQSDPSILTEKRYSLEKYAKGVGLVYREIHILDSQILDPKIAWEKRTLKGFITKMTRTN